MDQSPAVAVRNLVCRFGDVVAVAGVTLDVARGQFTSLLGPSGCGKTTLLRSIAGLQRQASGDIFVDGQEISKRPPHRRPVGLVFQRYALFSHKTVGDNVGFSLMLRRISARERTQRVEAMLDLVQLPGFADRPIEQLSGGQAQRVALARALVDDPPVLLLDEPLAALDLKLRQAMQVELREIQRRVGSTFVYVTHDQEEALVLSDRVVLMSEGAIVQQGPPREMYQHPRTLFAATFLGETNLFQGDVRHQDEHALVHADGVHFAIASNSETPNDASWVSLRPERITIAPVGATSCEGPNATQGTLVRVIFLGPLVRSFVQVGGREVVVEGVTDDGVPALSPGEAVCLHWDSKAPVLVSEE